jgi:hypothetical protein
MDLRVGRVTGLIEGIHTPILAEILKSQRFRFRVRFRVYRGCRGYYRRYSGYYHVFRV